MIAAAAVMVGFIFGAPVAANAGNPDYCADGRVCVYRDWNFGSGIGWRNNSFALTNISDANDNQASSWENRRTVNARWYKNRNGTGTCYTMSAQRENAQMHLLTQNDAMSSWAGNGAC
ncbi:MAG: peptidase inhibitor family I36 protein [Actinomycetia bacterium]|nr:peptidase inhibitor family I36 protein [Actinomycetes bacterium]